MDINFAVPCLLGLEAPIAEELRNMEASDVRAENGRVLFSGDENILARANICSRFSERVLVLLGSFEAHSFEELFRAHAPSRGSSGSAQTMRSPSRVIPSIPTFSACATARR